MSRITWLFDFGETEQAHELIDNLKYYSQLEGITQKRMVLLGIASYIEQRGNNPELIKQIAEYLATPRKNASFRSNE